MCEDCKYCKNPMVCYCFCSFKSNTVQVSKQKECKWYVKKEKIVMNELELENLQKELDEKKYLQSQTARQDLGGRMSYCTDCYFLKFDIEKQHLICNLDEPTRVLNCVCAKNHVRRLEYESTRIKTRRTGNRKS